MLTILGIYNIFEYMDYLKLSYLKLPIIYMYLYLCPFYCSMFTITIQ